MHRQNWQTSQRFETKQGVVKVQRSCQLLKRQDIKKQASMKHQMHASGYAK